jgi:hypothetical protein
VVDAHGGELTIRSAPGAGTEVGISLPIEPREASQSRRARLSLTNIPGLRDSQPSSPEITAEEREPPQVAGAK